MAQPAAQPAAQPTAQSTAQSAVDRVVDRLVDSTRGSMRERTRGSTRGSTNCEIEPTENDVCICRSGFKGYLCSERTFNKCIVNVTEPALYKGCKNKTDTDFYHYSIEGYDPCKFYDFDKNYTMKFKINCRPINDTSYVL